MRNQKIVPEKVTRPIQLLAAWLTGLIIIDGAFLTAASQLNSPSWAPGSLVIAAIVNVPLFLVSIFVLQTRYRPEMQEDAYYSKYLEYQHTERSLPQKAPDVEDQIKSITKNILKELGPGQEQRRKPIERIIKESQIALIAGRVGDSRTLSELYLRPNHWPIIVEHWVNYTSFKNDMSRLIDDGLIIMENEDYSTLRLTNLGTKVGEFAEKKEYLYAQQDERKSFWEEEGRLKIQPSERSKGRR